MRSVLNKRRHLSSVGVGIHDYASAPFVRWEDHDGLVFFQAFKCISHLLRDVRLWWFRLLKDTVHSSSGSICLLGVELSYGCLDLGDDLCGRNVRRS